MTLQQLGGCLLVLTFCPVLGALPFAEWMFYAITGKNLTQQLEIEARKIFLFKISIDALIGIVAVFSAKLFFPSGSYWEIVALLCIVMGRYWSGKGGGIISVLVGLTLHDWETIILIDLFASVGFAVFRTDDARKKLIFSLLGLIFGLRHFADTEYTLMAISLAGVLWWSDLKIPSKELAPNFVSNKSRVLPLDRAKDPLKVGRKAVNLARLKSWGHNIADGWIVLGGDDLGSVSLYLQPSPNNPLIVRSSLISDNEEIDLKDYRDFSRSSIINPQQLENALIDCLTRDDRYRVAALVQKQIDGILTGTVCSRDPENPIDNNRVLINISADPNNSRNRGKKQDIYSFDPDTTCLNIPEERAQIINNLATIAREVETLAGGIPQQIDWIYDGTKIWSIDWQEISNLQPIWTRNIIDKIVPRNLRPLTWSIYRSAISLFLAENLTAILGKKVADIDFTKIAMLHYSRIYLNVGLLTEILAKLGISLEDIERDPANIQIGILVGKFFRNWRNWSKIIDFGDREWNLDKNFFKDKKTLFEPILRQIASQELSEDDRSDLELLTRIEGIILGFNKASYYYLLVSLSLSLRQELLKPDLASLDDSNSPENKSLRKLASLAAESRKIMAAEEITINSCASLFAHLAEIPEGENVLQQLNDWLAEYGYLGEIPSDLATPRWRDNSHPAREIFTQIFFDPKSVSLVTPIASNNTLNWRGKLFRQRLELKGEIESIYQQLLANLRWSFLALEKQWLRSGLLLQSEDIFLLRFREIQRLIRHPDSKLKAKLPKIIDRRRKQVEENRSLEVIPTTVYGYPQNSDPIAY